MSVGWKKLKPFNRMQTNDLYQTKLLVLDYDIWYILTVCYGDLISVYKWVK